MTRQCVFFFNVFFFFTVWKKSKTRSPVEGIKRKHAVFFESFLMTGSQEIGFEFGVNSTDYVYII